MLPAPRRRRGRGRRRHDRVARRVGDQQRQWLPGRRQHEHFGLDAHLAAVFNSRTTRGLCGYLVSTVRETLAYESSYYILRASDVAISQKALIVALANTRQYGANVQIAPLARPDDGLLELVVLPAVSPLVALWHGRRLVTGTVHEVSGVTMQSVRAVDITSDSLPNFHVDGEVFQGRETLSAKVHPGALRVRCSTAS